MSSAIDICRERNGGMKCEGDPCARCTAAARTRARAFGVGVSLEAIGRARRLANDFIGHGLTCPCGSGDIRQIEEPIEGVRGASSTALACAACGRTGARAVNLGAALGTWRELVEEEAPADDPKLAPGEASLSVRVDALERRLEALEGGRFEAAIAAPALPASGKLEALARREAGLLGPHPAEACDVIADFGGLSFRLSDNQCSSISSACIPTPADAALEPMAKARKDGSSYLLKFRDDLAERCPRWGGHEGTAAKMAGGWVVAAHPGFAGDGFDPGWALAGPFGQGIGGDELFEGWRALPAGA